VIERPAKHGDMVLFEYSAQTADFRLPETGVERVGTVIGSGALLKALEDSLIGYKTGDSIEIDIAFPADFRVPQLAGRLARVSAKVMRVQEPKMPELDADFVSGFGIKDGDLAKFRSDVRANLERELKATLTVRLKAEVIDKLVAAHSDIELPKGLIQSEAEALAQQAQAKAQQAGQTVPAQPAAAYLEMAHRRVAGGVLLGEIARQAEIRLDSRRVAETLATIASTYEEPQRVIELYKNDPQLMSGLENRVLEDQVADWIANHANLTEQPLSFSEVMRPVTA
jgi:trigger factor